MPKPLPTVLSAVLLAASAAGAGAQTSPGPLVTDRPDQTESTGTVPHGFLQAEVGWTFASAGDGATVVHTHTVPQALARIGLGPRVELRLGFAGWSRSETDGAGPGGVASGVGDLDVGFKYRFTDEAGARPAVALVGTLAIPTGEEGFGGERPDPTVRVAFSNTLSDRVAVGYNAGLIVSSAPGAAGGTDTFVDVLYSVSFGFSLAGRLGAFAESFGTLALSDGALSQHSLDGGFILQLRDNLQFDVSAGVGLNGAADDWFVGAGLAVRAPR